MIRYVRHSNGLRCYVLGRRVHHGLAGSIALVGCLALRKRRAAVIAACVTLHDIRDFPFRDCDNHARRAS